VADPRISVVMAVRNGERHLGASVPSILTQTFSEFELIVVDDGSTDATPEILAGWRGEPRLRVLRQDAGGRPAALNAGIAIARAPLIARLDADDLALPTRLEHQHVFLAAHPDVVLLGGAVRFIDDDGAPFGEHRYPLADRELRLALTLSTPFVHSAAVFRRAAFDAAGGYRPAFGDADDLDLWLRLAERGVLANLPEIVVAYRVHADQASVAGLEAQTYCAIAARLAARARARGAPDPFAETRAITPEELPAVVSASEIAREQVRAALWLARTLSRAAHPALAEDMFALARRWARAPGAEAGLAVEVTRGQAQAEAEQGRPFRARLTRLRGVRRIRGARG
jgi:hypothetical protein